MIWGTVFDEAFAGCCSTGRRSRARLCAAHRVRDRAVGQPVQLTQEPRGRRLTSAPCWSPGLDGRGLCSSQAHVGPRTRRCFGTARLTSARQELDRSRRAPTTRMSSCSTHSGKVIGHSSGFTAQRPPPTSTPRMAVKAVVSAGQPWWIGDLSCPATSSTSRASSRRRTGPRVLVSGLKRELPQHLHRPERADQGPGRDQPSTRSWSSTSNGVVLGLHRTLIVPPVTVFHTASQLQGALAGGSGDRATSRAAPASGTSTRVPVANTNWKLRAVRSHQRSSSLQRLGLPLAIAVDHLRRLRARRARSRCCWSAARSGPPRGSAAPTPS